MLNRSKVLLIQLPHQSYPCSNVPLAAGYLKAAATAENLLDFDIEILNTSIPKFDFLTNGSLLEIILDRKPEIVGFTTFLWNSARTFQLCRKIKQAHPSTLVLVGGPDIAPVRLLDIFEYSVDICVYGMGEIAFLEILKLIQQNKNNYWKIPGVYTRQGTYILGSGHGLIPNYEHYPSPYLMGYFDLNLYWFFPLFTAQGCRSRCKYCAWGGRGPLKSFSKKRVIEELNLLKEFSDSWIYIMDSAFNISPIFSEVCSEISRMNLSKNLRVECFADATRLSSEQINMLASAKITNVEVGLQSTNPNALVAIGRKPDSDRLIRDIKTLHASGIPTCVDVILGLPADTIDGFRNTMQKLDDLNVGKHIFNLSISPGTILRTECDKWELKSQKEPPYYVLGTNDFPNEHLTSAFCEFVDYSSDYEKGFGDFLYFPQSNIHKDIILTQPIERVNNPCVSIIFFEENDHVMIALQKNEILNKLAAVSSQTTSFVFHNISQELALPCAIQLLIMILERDSHAVIDIIFEFKSISNITSVKEFSIFNEFRDNKLQTFFDYRNYFLTKARAILRTGSLNVFLLICPKRPLPKELEKTVKICWNVNIDDAVDPQNSILSSCLAQSPNLVVNGVSTSHEGHVLSVISKIPEHQPNCKTYFQDWGAQSIWDSLVRKTRSPVPSRQEATVNNSGQIIVSEYSNIQLVRHLLS